MTRLSLELTARFWPYREPFALSRGVALGEDSIQVRLTDAQGRSGRGEAVGVTYAGETTASMLAQIEAMRSDLEAGPSRLELQALLPGGGARMAIDTALWDLAAKQGGPDPFAASGVRPAPVTSVCTIGIRALDGYRLAARALSGYPMIKVKVDAHDPLAALDAVKRGAPNAKLIVDPNQSWSIQQLKDLSPRLSDFDVALLEQPIAVGDEPGLDGWDSPVLLCADELIDDAADLRKARGRFDVINIKLDKTGGLTTALRLADETERLGFGLMVGCMMGSSLSMAPAMVLAQRAQYVDLDGPLLHSEDIEFGFHYVDGTVADPYDSRIWG